MIDVMNLIFGAGEETQEFWVTILLYNTSQYYNFPYEELKKHKVNLNALFFALTYVFGISV